MAESALITGASGGIGLDLAREFARHGFDLILVARSADRLAAAAEELRAHGRRVEVLPLDLARPKAAETLVIELAARQLELDVLVNNAGYGLVGRFDQLAYAEQVEMVELNVTTLVALTRLLLPGMVERRRGRILQLASTAAFQPGPFMAVYYASKAFVLSFGEALWEELQGTGVTVTTLCPGPVTTNFATRAGAGDTNLFRRPGVMTSPEVARIGCAACLAGKRLVIPGRSNWIGTLGARLLPRRTMLRLVRGLQASKR